MYRDRVGVDPAIAADRRRTCQRGCCRADLLSVRRSRLSLTAHSEPAVSFSEEYRPTLIAVQIGALTSLAAAQRTTIAEFGLKAMVGGVLASLMTVSIVGVLWTL